MATLRRRYTKRVTTKRNFDFQLTSNINEEEDSRKDQPTGSVEVIISPPAKVVSSNSSLPVEDILRDSPVPLLLNNPKGTPDLKNTDQSTKHNEETEDANISPDSTEHITDQLSEHDEETDKANTSPYSTDQLSENNEETEKANISPDSTEHNANQLSEHNDGTEEADTSPHSTDQLSEHSEATKEVRTVQLSVHNGKTKKVDTSPERTKKEKGNTSQTETSKQTTARQRVTFHSNENESREKRRKIVKNTKKDLFKAPVSCKESALAHDKTEVAHNDVSNINIDTEQHSVENGERLNFTTFLEKPHEKGPLTSTPYIPKNSRKRQLKGNINIDVNSTPRCRPVEQQETKKKKRKKDTSGLSVRYWNGMPKERRIGDITDLDIILDCILKTLQEVIEQQESYMCEQAVRDLMDYLVKGIVYNIEKIQNIKSYKHKINKAKRKINSTRKQLLQVQQRNSELEMEIQQINKHKKKKKDERQISSWLDKLQSLGSKLDSKEQVPETDSKVFTTFGHVPDIG